MQEYGAPAGIDENRALERRQTAIAVLREVMGAERDQIFIKTRRRQKGPGQYQRQHDKPGRLFEVREGGGRFLVNFTRSRSEERRVGKECRSRWSPYH